MAMKPIGVSQLNAYIKRVLQTDPLLAQVSVLGEISNLKYHDSGHVYFSLKDAGGKINCFLPQSIAAGMTTILEDGLEIIAIGNVSVFERGGYYSLQIKAIEISGQGDLGLAFDQLKKQLLKEGLFDESHKKPIPAFPAKIAIITSQTGAAVQDMLKIIKGRNPLVDILVVPVVVQGPGAATSISMGIANVNQDHPETDVIIVGRGGGSLEELWAFNEEVVARSIYASFIPVISAVGHETDVTIADFVADVRAETPSAAAALAAPDIDIIRQELDFLDGKLLESLTNYFDRKTERLDRLDLAAFRNEIVAKIQLFSIQSAKWKEQMDQAISRKLIHMESMLSEKRLTLEHLNPKAIMDLGYAAILDPTGKLVTTIEQLHLAEQATFILKDGEADAKITTIRRRNDE